MKFFQRTNLASIQKNDGGLDTVLVWKIHKRESKEFARLNETMTACFRWKNAADLNQNKRQQPAADSTAVVQRWTQLLFVVFFPVAVRKGAAQVESFTNVAITLEP